MAKKGIDDPNYSPGSYIYGTTVFGMGHFGQARTYPQRAIFGQDSFGGCVFGMNTEAEVFKFRHGTQDVRTPRRLAAAPFLSHRKRGAWAKRIIYQVVHSKQRMRRYTPYDGSPKAHLVPFMPKFQEAVATWKTFPDDTKTALNARASKLGKKHSGYNFWISLWMKDKPERLKYLP